MAFFGFKKKKKEGRTSNISKFRSPYLKKLPAPENMAKRVRKTSLMIPPARLKLPSNRGKKILAAILSISIFGFCVYALYFSNYFLLEKFSVEEEGTIIDTNETINATLQKRMGQNLITFNEQQVEQEIMQNQPEIKNIQIKKIFPHSLTLSFEKYPTVANLIDTVGGIEKKFLIDSQGLLTEENSENPNLPYIKIETKEALQVRNTLLSDAKRSAERLNYILRTISLYEEKFGMKILNATFLPRERELHLYTEKYFYVIIDMEKDLKGQIDKLKKALSKLDIYNTPLQYIDLRISGNDVEKVIFKRKK